MKLSIWRQFSSNHSGSFSLVGRFATEDTAREAAAKLSELARRIDEWHANPVNQNWYEQEALNDLRPLTPSEAAIPQEYGIEWEDQGVDWYGGGHSPVYQIERDVFFSVGDTWCRPQPISALLTQFGAQTYEYHEFGDVITAIHVTLTCVFDTLEAVAEIERQIRQWNETRAGNPPWAKPEDSYPYYGESSVSCEGTHLRLELGPGIESMPALLEWLQGLNGHDIDYSFEIRHGYESRGG
jgi:hypothetical protein